MQARDQLRTARGLSGRRVAVFGASGFLGVPLCRRLLEIGCEVHGVRHERPQDMAGIRWWKADLTQPQAARDILVSIKPDIIYNVSGTADARPDRAQVLPTFLGNTLATVHVLVAAVEGRCERFIHCASLLEPDSDVTGSAPGSPYSLSKWAAGRYVEMFHRWFGLPTVTLHLGFVYGPSREPLRRLIPYTISTLLHDEVANLGSGKRMADWIYIDDAVEAFIAAAVADGAIGESFNVGSGDLLSIREMVERITRVVGSDVSPKFGVLSDRPPEALRQVDLERLEQKLGWRPRTPIDVGIVRTVEWYRRQALTLCGLLASYVPIDSYVREVCGSFYRMLT